MLSESFLEPRELLLSVLFHRPPLLVFLSNSSSPNRFSNKLEPLLLSTFPSRDCQCHRPLHLKDPQLLLPSSLRPLLPLLRPLLLPRPPAPLSSSLVSSPSFVLSRVSPRELLS